MIPHMDNKMVFAVRTDLGMTKGKVAAQCAHAAVRCYKKAQAKTPDYLRSWEMFGETKVALKIDSEEAIRDIEACERTSSASTPSQRRSAQVLAGRSAWKSKRTPARAYVCSGPTAML